MKPSRRIGFVRIDSQLWQSHSSAIKRSFSDSMILDIKPVPGSQSVDIVLIDSKFSDVDVDAPVPRYYCKIFVNEDGSVTRGQLNSEQTHNENIS